MKVSAGALGLVYPVTPVWVIGSYDEQGRPNIMTAAWVGVCCSEPRCVCAALGRASLSHENIMARRAYTVSIPSTRFLAEADYAGMSSGKKVDKFAATGLTPVRSELVDAPYVAEFPIILECRLVHALQLGSETQFIGEVLDVKVDEELLQSGSTVDMAEVDPILFAMSSTERRKYYALGREAGEPFSIGRTLGGGQQAGT